LEKFKTLCRPAACLQESKEPGVWQQVQPLQLLCEELALIKAQGTDGAHINSLG
jgi:hypothetical protein